MSRKTNQDIATVQNETEADVRDAVATLAANKGVDIIALDLRNISDATDYFIIASGSSDIHVKALARNLDEELSKKGIQPHHVEGLLGGKWVLLDYESFVVHVFHPEHRAFYQLERLWADAPELLLEPDG